MRWFRLAIGIYAVGQAILMHDSMIGFWAEFDSKPLQIPDAGGTQACAAPECKEKLKQRKPYNSMK